MTGIHWAEEPLSRTTRFIGKVQLLEVQPSAEAPREVSVRSRFLIERHRVDRESELFVGLRTDVLRIESVLNFSAACMHTKAGSVFSWLIAARYIAPLRHPGAGVTQEKACRPPSCVELFSYSCSFNVQIRNRLVASSTAANWAVSPWVSTASPNEPPWAGSTEICFTNLPSIVNSTISLG
jgi:Ring hydroxylating beta subunit